MRLPAFRLILIVLGLTAMTSVWALLALSQAGQLGSSSDMATTVHADSNRSGSVIDERRLQFGKIFLGTVVGVTGIDVVPTSDPAFNLPVIQYAVDVSQSVRGEVEGRVEIWYYDFNGQSADNAEYGSRGPLQVGARYLFFAGFDPIEYIYPVSDGVGVIPIHNDRKAARLIATIESLIEEVVREDAGKQSRYSCGRVSPPELSVSPVSGHSGDRVMVSAKNLLWPQASFWWNRPGKERLAAVIVREDCTFAGEMTIPNAAPGEHRLVVLDGLGQRTSADFTIVSPLTTPVAQGADPQRDFDQSQVSDEDRVQHGAIFIGRVDALEREQLRVSGGDEPPYHVQSYQATVERALAGTVSGQVRIEYEGAHDNSPESQGFGPLRIGEHYLFFADSAEIGPGYTVHAGSGAILITSDTYEVELTDHYLPLIADTSDDQHVLIARATATAEAQAVQEELDAAWAEVRMERAGRRPTVRLEPEQGLPGTRVLVWGKGIRFREVSVGYGKKRTSADVGLADGYFQAVIKIPGNTPPGVFPITVDDQHGFVAEVAFTVTD